MLQLFNHYTVILGTLLLAQDVRSAAAPCCARGPLQSPPCGGLTSPLLPVAHCDLYFNHKYAHPAPPARNTLFHKTKLGFMQTDLGELPSPSGQQKWSQWAAPGVPILLFARHNLCNSIFSQCPTEKIGGGKKGRAKVRRGPLLAGGYARIFIPRDASCRHGTRFSQRACRGPPHALGPTKERNMPDEEGEACPMTKTS